jgi:hypothetical protein
MNPTNLLTGLGASYALGLAGAVLWRAPREATHISFGLGIFALALESLLGALAANGASGDWRAAWLAAHAATACPWLYFTQCYARREPPGGLKRWAGPLGALMTAGMVFAAWSFDIPLIQNASGTAPNPRLAWPGSVVFLLMLVTDVWILTHLERTFRDSTGGMRWRIKPIIFGLGAIFVFRVFRGSQAVLYSAPTFPLQPAEACALLVGCGLLSVGLGRAQLFEVDLYASQTVLIRSLTLLITGIYLAAVGLLAKLVRYLGRDSGIPVEAVVILLALVGLALALTSTFFPLVLTTRLDMLLMNLSVLTFGYQPKDWKKAFQFFLSFSVIFANF